VGAPVRQHRHLRPGRHRHPLRLRVIAPASAARQPGHGRWPAHLRWLLRQTKPPKTKAAKKADRAAKKIGKADKRRQTAELDAEWATELAAPEHQTLLDPTDGPPLSPVQRAEYAERREMSDREHLAAVTAALFEGSTP
jgi:hypothetical protein